MSIKMAAGSESPTHERRFEAPDHSLFEVAPDSGLRIEPLKGLGYLGRLGIDSIH